MTAESLGRSLIFGLAILFNQSVSVTAKGHRQPAHDMSIGPVFRS
jgi:hypothetical protein